MISGQCQNRSAGTDREQPDFIDPTAEAAGYMVYAEEKNLNICKCNMEIKSAE